MAYTYIILHIMCIHSVVVLNNLHVACFSALPIQEQEFEPPNNNRLAGDVDTRSCVGGPNKWPTCELDAKSCEEQRFT